MLFLFRGLQALVQKKDFVFSGELYAAKWVKFEEVLKLLCEGSIAWQLVKTVIENSDALSGQQE